MLILGRTLQEKIVIDGGITITVTRIEGKRVWLGIDAPTETRILREEVAERERVEKDVRRFNGKDKDNATKPIDLP